MDEKILEIKELYKNFGKKELLKDLNLFINKGEVVCIIGKNGSGKTTLFNIILKNISYDFGKIIFNNNSEKDIAFFYQERNFVEPLKVKEILKIIESTFKKDKIKLNFFKSLQETFGIDKLVSQKISHLSGGQKQVLSLFQTIMSFPKILFLDEFSNNLDEESLKKIKKLLLEFVKNEQKSIFFASHKIEEIQEFADRIIILKNKKIDQEINIKKLTTKELEKLFEKI